MADGDPIAGLYPQPQSGQGGNALTSNLPGLIQAMSFANQNALFQKEYAAKAAVGQAVQSGIRPDGSYDSNAAMARVAGNPAAAWAAPEAVTSILEQRNLGIDTGTKALSLATAQNGSLQNVASSWATDPNVTPDKVRSDLVDQATRLGIPPWMVTSTLAGLPASGKAADINKWAGRLGTIQMGPGDAASRVQGPVTSTGAPTQVSKAATYGPQPVQTDLGSGQGTTLSTNQAAFTADQQGSAAKLAGLRPLQTALPLIEKLSNTAFGPGSAGWSQVKAGLITSGIIPANTTDVDMRQEVNKYLHVYSGQARGAERSDQGLQQATASTPNLDLTQGANLALVKNQIGMDRMDAALPLAFDKLHPTLPEKAQYGTYKSQYYQNQDPKAFQFDLMTPQERKDYLTGLGVTFDKNGAPQRPANPSPAYKKFANSYAIAKSALNYTPPQAQPNGQ